MAHLVKPDPQKVRVKWIVLRMVLRRTRRRAWCMRLVSAAGRGISGGEKERNDRVSALRVAE